MADYRNKKLLYHLTMLNNLSSIVKYGLMPRAKLRSFYDVANQEIIACREGHNLDSYVPFHFFPKNPFDYDVVKNHPNDRFVLITVSREFAQENNFKILTQHPLSLPRVELLDYDQGMEEIDWELMNTRNYQDYRCKQVCMAECLTDKILMPEDFYCIYVKDRATENAVVSLTRSCSVSVFPHMFYSL